MEISAINEEYSRMGYNTDSIKRWLKSHAHNGYDEAFDSSLLVVYFDTFTVIVGTSHLQFAGAQQ